MESGDKLTEKQWGSRANRISYHYYYFCYHHHFYCYYKDDYFLSLNKWASVNYSLYSWIIFFLLKRALISMWDVAGFLFCMQDKSLGKLPYGIIKQPLILFNAIQNCAISVAICSLNCLFSVLSTRLKMYDENIYVCSRTWHIDTLKPDTIRFCLYSDILIDWFSHISCTFKISDPHLTSIDTINELQIIRLCEFIKT